MSTQGYAIAGFKPNHRIIGSVQIKTVHGKGSNINREALKFEFLIYVLNSLISSNDMRVCMSGQSAMA